MKLKKLILSLSLTLLLPIISLAAEEVSKEDRAKMADMHQKMADCLKSDKSIDVCHSEMRAACGEAGPMGCGMGMDHRHHGGGPGSMKYKGTDSKPTPKK